jgi:hypothetical protein
MRQPGLAIFTGRDARLSDEIRPDWATDAESIVAHALATEVKSAQLFQRVKIHADTVNPKKYSTIIRFRVLKFECYNHAAFLENTGRELLAYQGLRGALIERSIPTKYVSEVAIEFAVLDATTQQPIFTRTYNATHTDAFNGYQGEKPKVQQTSAALQSVLTQFLTDLTRLPAVHSVP